MNGRHSLLPQPTLGSLILQVELHAAAEASEGDEDDSPGIEKTTQGSDDSDSGDDADDDMLEIDTEAAFQDIAKGRDFITLDDMRAWEVVAGLREDGLLADGELEELCKDAGVTDLKKINVEQFDEIFASLMDSFDDEEVGEEEDM